MDFVKSVKNSKVAELESIRGIAAFLVVCYHIPNWNVNTYDFSIVRGASAMVDLFFVLSGFVIYSAYKNKINNILQLVKFQFLRFGRLYPVHLFFILVYLGIETLKYILQYHFGLVSHSRQPFEENNFWAFLREALLIKAFYSNETAMAVNSPSWSISAEFYTYIAFSMIVLFANRFKIWIFAFLFLLGVFLLNGYDFSSHNFMLRCLTGFFLGCCTAEFITKFQVVGHTVQGWTILLAFFIIILICTNTHGAKGLGLLIYPASAMLISTVVLANDNIFNRFLSQPILVWLGSISYSLYMCHGAVLWFFQQALRFLFHPTEVVIGSLSVIQLNTTLASLSVVVYLGLSFFVAFLTYKFIEEPFRYWSREVSQNW